MQILFRFFLIIFSLAFIACKQDTTSQIQTKVAPTLPDAVLLSRADSLYDLAETITDLKKSDSALSLHQRALAIREKLLTNDLRLVNSYYKVGMLYYRQYKYEMADEYLERSRKIGETIHAPLSIIYDIYLNLSICKKEVKDFPTATSIVQRLLHLIQERDPENKKMIAKAYDRLAAIYHYLDQEEKALETWQQAQHLTSDDHQFLSELFYKMSVASSKLKRHQTSLRYINKSIHETLTWAGFGSKPMADQYLWKAFVLVNLNQMDSVPYFLHRTLQIRRRLFGEKDTDTYGAKLGLGEFYYIVGQYDSAVYYDHESLISKIRNFNNSNIFSNPNPDETEMNMDVVGGLVNKALALHKLFENDSTRTELLDLALNTFLLADSVFAGYRKNILHDDPVMQQLEVGAIPYAEVLSIISKLLKKKKSGEYLEKAFRVMESSRAIVLQNALNRAASFKSVGISDALVQKENGFIRVRAELLQKMSDQGLGPSVRDSLNEMLLLTSNDEVEFHNELKIANPNYFLVRYEPLPSSSKIRKIMKERNSIHLEYMWSDSVIYALMIGPDTVRLNAIPITGEFRKTFGGFINEFHGNPEETIGLERYKNFCHNASSLYNCLLKSELDGIDPNAHIIISADGPLATIPFDALITHDPKGEEVNYHLPYLVLEHPISYAYSAGVLMKQSAHLRDGKRLLALGYAGGGQEVTTRSGLTNLPGTEREILAIKDVMKNHVNQYKLKGEASEYFFKQQISDFDIVHLAIHGEGDTLNSLNSRLIFRSEEDTVEDGSLYAHELYDLKLDKLDLAVLSACESGVGKKQKGEGVMSIARGFVYAGCPSLVMSLWRIDDRTSAQVMKSFYRYLSDGEYLDVSLANAKMDYIRDAGEFKSHPFYWAAFLQVGDTRPIAINDPGWKIGIAILFLILLIAAFAVLKRSHEKQKLSKDKVRMP